MSNALVYTATSLSFTAATKTIADSANGLGNYIVGSRIRVTGSVANNSDFTIVTVAAGALTVSESITTGAAGPSVTLTVITPVSYVIREVAEVLEDVANIRQAPATPQETQNVDPFVVTYLANGVINVGPIGTKKGLLNIACDLFIPRTDLGRDIPRLLPFVDSIPHALLAEVSDGGDLFSQTIQTYSDLSTTFLPAVDYGGAQMIGYRFLMEDVKILVPL